MLREENIEREYATIKILPLLTFCYLSLVFLCIQRYIFLKKLESANLFLFSIFNLAICILNISKCN